MAEGDVVKNVIWRTSVETGSIEGAKETAASIRAINDAAKEGVPAANALEAAQTRARESAGKNAAQYDANAKAMGTMFKVIQDGTRNVLAYIGLDGQLRKVDASFRTGADGAVELTQELADVGAQARTTGGDLDALKKKAADITMPISAVPPTAPGAAPASPTPPPTPNGALPFNLADLDQLSEGTREFVEALLQASDVGTEGFAAIDAAAQRELATLKELIEATKKSGELAGIPLENLQPEQQADLDHLEKLGLFSAETKKVVAEALQIANTQELINEELAKGVNLYGSQAELVKALEARLERLRAQSKQVGPNKPEEQGPLNDEIRSVVEQIEVLKSEVPKAFDPAPLAETISLLDQYKSRVELLTQRRDSVTDTKELSLVNDLLTKAKEEYQAVATSSAQAGTSVKTSITEQTSILDQYLTRVKLLEEKKLTITDPEELARVNAELKVAQTAFDGLASKTAKAFPTGPVSEMVTLLDQYAAKVQGLEQRKLLATTPEEITLLNGLLKDAQTEFDAFAVSAATASTAASPGLSAQVAILDQYKDRVAELENRKLLATTPEEVGLVNEQLAALRVTYDRVREAMDKATNPEKGDKLVQTWSSLRTQMQEAKANLDRIVEANTDLNGKLTITPELLAAGRAAGQLQDRFEDLNATVNAFNPDKKFQVLAGLVQNVLGGFTALQGALALIGVNGEGVEKSLLKVQSALAITQGLQALFGGLSDNLRNARILLANAAAGFRTFATAQLAAGATTTGFAGAVNLATGAVRGLWLTLVANPVGVVVAAIAVLVATVYALVTANEEARVSADDLLNSLERVAKVREFQSTEGDRLKALDNEARATAQIIALEKERAAIPKNATEEQKALANQRIDEKIAQVQRIKEIQDLSLETRNALRTIEGTQEDREQVEEQIIELYKRGGTEFVASEGKIGKAALEGSLARIDQTENETNAALRRALVNQNLSSKERENLDKLEDAFLKSRDVEAKAEADLLALRKKGRNDTLAFELAMLKLRQQGTPKKKEEDNPLAGSIAAAQKELNRLQAIAKAIPQDAFSPDVLEAINVAIEKAQADLFKLQQTFVENSAERLQERQRNALALAEIDQREAITRLKAEGATPAVIAQAEAEWHAVRIDREITFLEERLALLRENGKLSVAEEEAIRNKIDELRKGKAATGSEDALAVNDAVTQANLAALEEEKRHTLAMAQVDEDAALAKAEQEKASGSEITTIQQAANRQRLLLEIDFELQRLKIMRDSGTATEAEINAQINKIQELRAQLTIPEDDQTDERIKELVGKITGYAEQIARAGIQAWRAWSDAAAASIDRQIALQQKRVDAAEKIADKGNAKILEEEKKRLKELTDARQKAAERNSAIAQVEAAANAAVAISRAAAEGGGFASAITIAATLIALAAGLAQARQLATASVPISFYRGGEAKWSTMGGYTGDGDPKAPSTAVGAKPYQYERREFVMDHKVTSIGRNREWFDRILRGRVNVDHLIHPRAFVKIEAPAPAGFSEGQVDRIITALKEQPGTKVTTKIDRRGIVQMVQGRIAKGNKLRNV